MATRMLDKLLCHNQRINHILDTCCAFLHLPAFHLVLSLSKTY